MVIPRPAPHRRPRGPRRGYNLVILMVLVTVMNVLVAVAMPAWSHVMRREREQELIFRGLQYAEAIRVFQVRNGRYPTSLAELIEVEPRSIRRLWTDPFRDDGKWGLVLVQTQRGQRVGGPEAQGEAPAAGRPEEDEGRSEDEEGDPTVPIENVSKDGDFGAPEGVRAVGPVIGVRSITEKDALTSFLGSTAIQDWEFTADLIPVLPAVGALDSVPRLTSRYIGRPFPEGLEPSAGNVPGTPSGQPGEPADRPASGADDE